MSQSSAPVSRRRWTSADFQTIIDTFATHSVEQQAALLSRTPAAVVRMRVQLARKGQVRHTQRARVRRWTEADYQTIIDTFATHSVEQQAQLLGRTYDAVVVVRQQLARAGRVRPDERANSRPWTAEEDERIADMVAEGRTYRKIGRELGRTTLAVKHRIFERYGGIRALHARDLERIWTTADLARLFGMRVDGMCRLLQRGWFELIHDGRRRRRSAYRVTTHALQAFLQRRDLWPAWSPAQMTDPDWAAYARELREQAGGHWIPLQAVLLQYSLSEITLSRVRKQGGLDDLAIMQLQPAYYVWSADVNRLVERVGAARRRRRRRTP